ncbi:peptidase inhibitor family I36 protein [Streptomyces sp. MB09-02B]|uniref:peptidase inhibitor family I36 protein n=1 Tax=Streptomyces sp. MB09-02B TaxID=3028667 RepID=UPI0029B6E110|nr:peptidase inhibitor family I36 protein [Streptomyces sp. MB09-02B]MDX3643969.1 peptidase inhibitor family I36 protein [Streptomyces sp. MB09-02B]
MSSYQQVNDRKQSRRPRRIRRILAAVGLTAAVASLGLVAPGSASAAPQAWECDTGDVCVWNNINGTGGQCAWTNSDPDWWNGSVQCSWSDTRNVRSVWNRGTSSSYNYVVLYTGANYTGTRYCFGQDGGFDNDFNARIRSHRWQASC